MAEDQRMIDAPSVVFGVGLMFVGTALALDRLHVLDATQLLRLWPAGLILLGASLVVQAIRIGRSGEAARLSVRPSFHGGHVLGIVILVAIVAYSLRGRDAGTGGAGDRVTLIAVLSGHERVSSASRFRGGELTSIMGRAVLDLRHATPPERGTATLEIFGLMGGVVLRVPEDWVIEVQAAPVMAAIRDERRSGRYIGPRRAGRRDAASDESGTTLAERPDTDPTPPAPRLVVRGAVVMGELIIRS